MIVVPFIGDEPVMLYSHARYLPRAGRKVSEIDLVGWFIRGTHIPSSPAPGFTLLTRAKAQLLTVVRYRAATPRTVTWKVVRHGIGTLQMKALTAG